MTRTKITLTLATAALAALALAGCSGGGGAGGAGPYGGGASPTTSGGTSAAAAGNTDGSSLATASTSLGTVVVDSAGMTVYFYGPDTKGETTSACTGACAVQWPPVTTSGTPHVTGVTGPVGTIAGPNGTKQVTLDGLPIYTYAGDSAKGDVNGQLVGNVWWAVTPAGAKITKPAPTAATGSGY